MAKPPAFQFYARDWLSDGSVMGMPLGARGAYITLLASQWLEGSVPADQDKLRRILGGEDLSEIWPWIADKFPATSDPQRLANPKLEKVRSDMEERRIKQSEGGKKGAESHWGKLMAKPIGELKPAVAVAVSCTTTATAPAAAVEPKEPTAAPSYPLACVVAANTALDALLAGGHKPLRADLEAPTAEAWQHDGVPLPVALATIRDAVAHYRVRPGNRQPHSLRYFDGAVREAWEKSRGALGAKPKPITDQPPPPEPTPEEHLAHLERLAVAQAERNAQPRRRGNIGAIPLPERTAA